MGEIIVNQKSGQLSLQSFNPLISVSKAEHSQELMSTDKIDISVQSSVPLSFNIGDYIEHEGRRFTLNLNPKVNKQNESRFLYDLIFEGVQYDLIRKIYFNYDSQGNYTTGDFPLTGEINVFLLSLIANANRDKKTTDFTWVLGSFPNNTDTKTITFSNTNCLAALQNICKEFELEFEVIQDILSKTNTINIKSKVGSVLPFTFEYGYRNGLYSLTRDRVSDGQVTTRLYPYGSSENIPTNYRNFSPRLKLPTSYGKDYIQDDAKVLLYGLNEEIINYDDIKPTFKGVLTSVSTVINSNNTIDVIVGNMDFDLNEKKPDGSTKYLIAGTPAKFHVNKGNLAGYEFEIHSYDHATKKFQLKVQTDERGQKFPDLATVFKFAVGDEIVLIDIILPQVYIDNAETRLKDKAIEDYAVKSQNNVKYSLDIDPMFLVELGYTEYTKIIGVGDYAGIKDTQLNVNKSSRIVSLKRDLLNPFKYSADISDTYELGIVTQIVQDIQNVQTQIHTQTQVNAQAMLSGYRRMLELQGLVFDTDGNFDMSHFAAGSITTSMLSVGARSQELTLKDVVFTPNKDGNANNISISAGSLIHFSIDPAGVKTWNLAALNQTGLIASNSYYIYARVSRSGNTGTYVVTTEQRKFDQESGFYNFLLGVLFQPQNGVRLIHLNYGATYINGRVITTGRISSIDGLNWFDLDTGEFRGKFIFTDGTNVQGAVNGASAAAAAAQATANNAISQITDIASDSKLTPNEKQVLVNEWNRIKIEYSQNSSVATSLGLLITAYQNAYNVLDGYITPLLSNLSVTSDIVGSTFRTNFQNYYNQNVAIVTAIENKKITNISVGGRNLALNSKEFIDSNAQWVRDFYLSESLKAGNEYVIKIWCKSVQNGNAYFTIGDQSGFLVNLEKTYSIATSNEFVGKIIMPRDSNGQLVLKRAPNDNSWYQFEKLKIESGNKATDWNPAPEDVQEDINNAQTTANNAINILTDIGSDNKLTASEKQTTLNEWNRIKSEYSEHIAKANLLSLNTSVYQNAYNNLNSYITPLLSNLNTTSDIVGNTFRANFQNYYDQNVIIVSAIGNKQIENISIGGRNLALNSKKDIDSNSFFVTDFNLAEALKSGEEYTFSVRTKVANQNPSAYFSIGDLSGALLSLTKASDTLYTGVVRMPRDSNGKITLFRQPDDSSYYQFESIKIEKGNKASDWLPAPEDVQSQIDTNTANTATALAQANNAINTANNVANLTSFLQTSIQGNVVGTGTLLVGDVLGANAMICGVTDRPNGESLRFAAGKNYANKYRSPFQVLDNGMVRFVNPTTGQKTFELGFNQNTGKVVFDIYNDSGVKVASIGSQGIMFTGYVPESYTKRKFRKLTTTSFTPSAINAELTEAVFQKFEVGRGQLSGEILGQWIEYDVGLNASILAYEYYEGRNFESADNSQYAGFYTTANKFGSKIDDGIYAKQQVIGAYYSPSEGSYNTSYSTDVYLVEDGKIISSYSYQKLLSIATIPVRGNQFPPEDYEQ